MPTSFSPFAMRWSDPSIALGDEWWSNTVVVPAESASSPPTNAAVSTASKSMLSDTLQNCREMSWAKSSGSGSVNNQVYAAWANGIGWNSTTATSGQRGLAQARVDGTALDTFDTHTITAQYIASPAIGINVATCLEVTTNLNNASVTWNGTVSGMLMLAKWEG